MTALDYLCLFSMLGMVIFALSGYVWHGWQIMQTRQYDGTAQIGLFGSQPVNLTGRRAWLVGLSYVLGFAVVTVAVGTMLALAILAPEVSTWGLGGCGMFAGFSIFVGLRLWAIHA
ncbi:MAG: hypothetical protein ACLFTK_05045, partial [Anaerolineales bacterium]